MRPTILNALCSRHVRIRASWETLLRLEKVNGPLAHPDALTHHITTSIFEIVRAARRGPPGRVALREARAIELPVCACGRNPFLAYFGAGEQAMLEALVQRQAEHPDAPARNEAEAAELIVAVRLVASAELEDFCGACILKPTVEPVIGEPTAAG